jgi:hypothetical protein
MTHGWLAPFAMERLCRVAIPGFLWPVHSSQHDVRRIIFLAGSGADAGLTGGSAGNKTENEQNL